MKMYRQVKLYLFYETVSGHLVVDEFNYMHIIPGDFHKVMLNNHLLHI